MSNESPIRWTLTLEALFGLLVGRLLCALPMRWWSRLADLQLLSGNQTADDERADLREVQRHLRGVSRRVPWRADCLPQALAAMSMLVRRGYAPVLHLGARLNQSAQKSGMSAHAWVECAGRVVSGGSAHRDYHSVARLVHRGRG